MCRSHTHCFQGCISARARAPTGAAFASHTPAVQPAELSHIGRASHLGRRHCDGTECGHTPNGRTKTGACANLGRSALDARSRSRDETDKMEQSVRFGAGVVPALYCARTPRSTGEMQLNTTHAWLRTPSKSENTKMRRRGACAVVCVSLSVCDSPDRSGVVFIDRCVNARTHARTHSDGGGGGGPFYADFKCIHVRPRML